MGLQRGDNSLAFDAAVMGGWGLAAIVLALVAGDAVKWGRDGGDAMPLAVAAAATLALRAESP